jgi:hypothetical protein
MLHMRQKLQAVFSVHFHRVRAMRSRDWGRADSAAAVSPCLPRSVYPDNASWSSDVTTDMWAGSISCGCK